MSELRRDHRRRRLGLEGSIVGPLENSTLSSRISIMSSVEREIDRILLLLRHKIRERGFNQLEVQTKLDWGRSYVSQLLTKQKSLRVEQLLMILEAIGVEAREFFAELYPLPQPDAHVHHLDARAGPQGGASFDGALVSSRDFLQDYGEFRATVRGVVEVLVDKDFVTLEEIDTAVKAAGRE